MIEFLKALKKARELRLAPSHHAIVRELDSEKMYETEYNSNMWTQQGGIIAFFKNWDGDGRRKNQKYLLKIKIEYKYISISLVQLFFTWIFGEDQCCTIIL